MNRCITKTSFLTTSRMLRIAAPAALLAGLVLASLGSTAQVISRPFPPNAMRGILTVTQPPEVLMDGKADRLSPGARIRGANNMLVMSGALVGQAMRVNYTREPNGYIHDVWVLTDAEASLPPPNQR
jgi:hypothetical protein